MVCRDKENILNMVVLDWSTFPEDLNTEILDLHTSESNSIKKIDQATLIFYVKCFSFPVTQGGGG